mgnify:CR=1 FL=1
MDIYRLIKQYRILEKKNVVGYSNKIRLKIVKGEITDIPCIRIYVSKKVPVHCLRKEDIIPSHLGDIQTDIVEIGTVTAPPNNLTPISTSKTKKFRPVKLGVSIGHWDITAGSLGMLYSLGKEILAGSNAHVLTPDPALYPKEIKEKRILQPGAYHGGQNPENVVGLYYYHERIIPIGESKCKLANGIVWTLNKIAKILGRKGKFKYEVVEPNHIDFGVYSITVPHELEVADGSLSDEPFIGHLFAGSSRVGVICKVKYIIEQGFYPLIRPTDVNVGDRVKGCSFWCNYETEVIDESASLKVNYGNYLAYFEDVILVANQNVIRGGWSGSGFRKIEG